MDCNLYEEERIILTCTVSSQGIPGSISPNLNSLNIKWFFNNGTEYELVVGTNETRREGGNGIAIVISSTLTISGTLQENTSPLAQGLYYCRVNVASDDVVSNSSQQFIVLDLDRYFQSGTNCVDSTFIAGESACAVHSIAVMNPTITDSSDRENLTTLNHPNVTDVTTVQEADTTMMLFIQSAPDQNDGIPEIWIYILVSVLAIFLIIIVILTVFVLRFCLMIRK